MRSCPTEGCEGTLTALANWMHCKECLAVYEIGLGTSLVRNTTGNLVHQISILLKEKPRGSKSVEPDE